MSDGVALVLALVLLAASLAVAIARPPRVPESLVAAGGALLLVAVGAVSAGDAVDVLGDLAPTVGLLAALLVLAEGCRREGLFDAIGALVARRARGRPRRLLALIFVVATATTAVLSLDATVVLLTPVVVATAARVRTSPRPHVYACSHLANTASLLLPVSNLTNLLAFHASGLSFARFTALMAVPAVAAVAIEWLVLSRFFATDLARPHRARARVQEARPLPRFPVVVLAATLAGFTLSSTFGVAPVWVAVTAALALTAPALARRRAGLAELLRATEPGFLVFVLGLGVVVAAAADHGLRDAVERIVPAGESPADLVAIAALAAVLANVVNNLPATLILVPVTAAVGPAAVLAMLIGVNVGPNLTYVGSLATLLWRRILHREDEDVALGEFLRLAVVTVPPILLAAPLLLWLAVEAIGVG